MMNRKRLYGLLVLATVVLYGLMLFWTGPQILRESGGLLPFDTRITGYSTEDAAAFLGALSARGRAVYLGPAMAMDSLFPLLLTLVLAIGLWSLSRRKTTALRLAFVLVAGLYGLFDYLENAAVGQLLRGPAAVPDPALVTEASRATVLKWVFVACAVLSLGWLGIEKRKARRT